MALNSANFIQGPATIWLGAFGAAEPATLAAAWGAPWTDLGATKDGISIEVADEYAVLEVDQLVYEAGRTRTKRTFSVKTSLAEATLDNLARALNDAAPVTATGTATFEPGSDSALFLPAYCAIGVDGIAPSGRVRRGIFRKMLQSDTVEHSYKKDGQTVYPVTFMGHWVSPSIKPFKYTDATA